MVGSPVITISCKTENGFYLISVSDNGIGLEQSFTDQIFEEFNRIPNKQNYSGSGIGLAVYKKIISNHNGSITVASELGKGTRFEIKFALSSAEVSLMETESSLSSTILKNLRKIH